MKGKRDTTEDKIRVLREADRGKSILEVCREHNLSEVSFHRWKKQFGQMDLKRSPQARRNSNARTASSKRCSLKRCAKNRVLEAVAEKKW